MGNLDLLFKAIRYVSNPITLLAFVLATFALIIQLVLRKVRMKPFGEKTGFKIISLIVKYSFWLLIVVGVVACVYTAFQEKTKANLEEKKTDLETKKLEVSLLPDTCELDILLQKPFTNRYSTKILIATFQGENPEDKKFGKNISKRVYDKLEEFLEDSLKLDPTKIEIRKLDCYIESHDRARRILDTLGADIFVWGNNFCSTKSELAKFCPKATLTKRISSINAEGKWSREIRQLDITDVDLPALTAEEPYQLLNFIFGLHLCLRGEFKEATVYFEKTGDEIYGNQEGIENVYFYLAYTYEFLSRNDKALEYYEKILKIFRELKYRKREGMILNRIGVIYSNWGKHDQAIDYYKNSLKIFKDIGDRKGERITMHNIATSYCSLGKYERAIEYLERESKICQDTEERRGQSLILYQIGMLYNAWGKYDQAIRHYKKALEKFQKIGNRLAEAWTLLDIGDAYYAWGQYDQAGVYYKNSLQLTEEVWDRNQDRGANRVVCLPSYYSFYYDTPPSNLPQALDLNYDGNVDIGDIGFLINYLYHDGSPPYLPEAKDPNCDGTLDARDVVYLVNYLFRGGP